MEGWRLGLTVAFTLVDIMAIVLNLSVVLVIIKTPQLRGSLTNSFVINLCIIDLLGTFSIVPIWITAFLAGEWIFPQSICDLYGYGSAFLSYNSIWTTCLISVERYFSIAYPMLHAANLTLPRTLISIISTWILSIMFAALPVLYHHNYEGVYEESGATCINTFGQGVENNVEWIIIGIVCFCVPTIIVLLMYTGILRVARSAQQQIQPSESRKTSSSETVPSIDNLFHQGIMAASTRQISTVFPSNEDILAQQQHQQPIIQSPIREAMYEFRHAIHHNSFSKEFLPKVGQMLKIGKATRTVISVAGLFLGLWMPQFFILFYGSVNPISNREMIDSLVTWLTFLTLVANPTLYGIANRPIRHELSLSIPKCIHFSNDEDDAEPSMGDEDVDFLQFLERTSSPEIIVPPKNEPPTAGNQKKY